ncbi:RteC domain-containing protein [Pedobacter sp. GR22-10]|uniref:RteC domain-containing protein n=1 Tax=Pedobacter sp. GR22-10 TaxID=2994472 RepID=UPI00224660A5|nr:RteC domain-containing protein [Pedobacter sp. GR22-10]MCX2429908.1 RteC domain-containing protein [Pedobacter sp. GR22-10]
MKSIQAPNTNTHMDKFSRALLAKMDTELQRISIETENHLQQAEQSFYLMDSILKELKEFFITHNFQDEKEEIIFFKEVKPMFLRELIYYNELYETEAHKPIGSAEEQKHYYMRILESKATYFDRNKHIYNYYRRGISNLDELWFLRKNLYASEVPVYMLDMDLTFTTPNSFILSKLQAYEKLLAYLKQQINPPALHVTQDQSTPDRKSQLTWTDSKSALIELAYALQARGAINFGKGDVIQVVNVLEAAFNVNVGNPYRVFHGMLIRKKSRHPFLDDLTVSLDRMLDQKDE